jgi:hypothetical protein
MNRPAPRSFPHPRVAPRDLGLLVAAEAAAYHRSGTAATREQRDTPNIVTMGNRPASDP